MVNKQGSQMRLTLFRRRKTPSGLMGKTLMALGPTWFGSPVRRLVQSICLLAFLALFFYVCWPYGSKQYAEAFSGREKIDAELFLILDPLVAVSTAIAAKMLVWSLPVAGAVVVASLLFPRAFCGYVCPLGTLLDLFDRIIGKRVTFFRLKRRGWWVNIRYFLLAAVLAAALSGVLLAGFVAPIPVLTRAMLLIPAPVQTGLLKGWYLVPPGNAGYLLSIVLVVLMFCLGLMGRRFWCTYVCPTGAFFSLCSMFRLTERRVTGPCAKCGQCAAICSFGAIKEDFSTRFLDCTFCQSCAGVCPAGRIEFTWRWRRGNRERDAESIFCEAALSRRSVLAGVSGAAVGGLGISLIAGGASSVRHGNPPIRPPGSVPEDTFLRLCIRCGECIKVCPNNVLQPAGFEHGFNVLWTPKVAADWSGCEPSCNNCGHVCPTGAVRALSLKEKRAARIGLAQVDRSMCLPYAGRGACQLCVDECRMAGYDAIEFIRTGSEVDEKGEPAEGRGHLAPVVREDRCVGCGLCQMRCHAINVKMRGLLRRRAIEVVAGDGKEDRIMDGSYIALRDGRVQRKRSRQSDPGGDAPEEYLPAFLK